MKIGLFTDTYFPQVSGVATSIKTLKEQLELQGHEVYIFTSTDPKVKKPTIEPHIYRFSSMPFIGFKDRRITYRGGFQALQIAKKLQLDLVHTQTEFSLGLIGKFVARQMKIPVVHTFHTNYEDYLHYVANGRLIRPADVALIARYFLNSMTAIVSPSQQTFDTLMKYKVKAPVEIIPTGVKVEHSQSADNSEELHAELGLSQDAPIMMSIGRVAFEKNIDEALSVFAEVLKDVPDAVFVIVGNGPAMSSLKDHAEAIGVSGSVIFVGEVNHDQIYGYYRLGDVFVSASTSETQGLTFIEAITADAPVVAMHSDYMDTIVVDENIGTLVDDSSEMIEPIVRYLRAKQAGEVVGDPTSREQILHEIDERTFGKRINEFYEFALTLYHDDVETDEEDDDDAEYARSFLHPFRRDSND